MTVSKSGRLAVAVGVGALAFALTAPAMADPVSFNRLVRADQERGNWLTHHRTYDGQRFSPLTEINKTNVSELKMVVALTLDGMGGAGRVRNASLEGTPLVDDGMMYITDGWNQVYKVDVRSGDRGIFMWKWDPEMDRAYAADSGCCQGRNRGVALFGDLVYESTQDGRMVALDKNSGELVWEAVTANNDMMESHTGAPLALNGIVINGVTGAEYGIRGHLDALNAETGETAWRRYIIPGPGEPGFETWTDNYDAWQTGGGSIWQAGTYDADLNITYWGTGNPSPQFDSEYRPGDNLYTESLLALDADTGEILWHFQFTPNDPYDYDEIGEAQIIDVMMDGQSRRIVSRVARNGFVYAMDAADGTFLHAGQYVDVVNWTDGIDPKTGRPMSYNPDTQVQLYNPGTAGRRDNRLAVFCPTLGGGKNWQPAAYSPQTGLQYTIAAEGCSAYRTVEGGVDHWADKGNKLGSLDNRDPAGWRGREGVPGDTPKPVMQTTGSITGIDPATGQNSVKISLPDRPTGVVATAGGLVFSADGRGEIMAFDAETLAPLWSKNVGTGIAAPPMTYAVGGKQYVAVLAGRSVSGSLQNRFPELAHMNQSTMLFIFSL